MKPLQPPTKSPLYHYRAFCRDVYDGDTITADIDLGLSVTMRDVKLRLLGVDAPEMRGPDRDRGVIARDWLRSRILDQEILIQTKKDDREKYGRLLAIVWLDEVNINKALLDQGLAVPFLV